MLPCSNRIRPSAKRISALRAFGFRPCYWIRTETKRRGQWCHCRPRRQDSKQAKQRSFPRHQVQGPPTQQLSKKESKYGRVGIWHQILVPALSCCQIEYRLLFAREGLPLQGDLAFPLTLQRYSDLFQRMWDIHGNLSTQNRSTASSSLSQFCSPSQCWTPVA